jgi:hypothetical protein
LHTELADAGSVQVDVHAPRALADDQVITPCTGYGPPPLVAPVPEGSPVTPAGTANHTSVADVRVTLT